MVWMPDDSHTLNAEAQAEFRQAEQERAENMTPSERRATRLGQAAVELETTLIEANLAIL